MQKILQRIRNARDKYDTCKLSLVAEQTEIIRDLSIAYSELTDYRIEANERWNEEYFKAQGSNASREKEANKEVPEMYLIRRTMESTKVLIDTVRSTLSVAKTN